LTGDEKRLKGNSVYLRICGGTLKRHNAEVLGKIIRGGGNQSFFSLDGGVDIHFPQKNDAGGGRVGRWAPKTWGTRAIPTNKGEEGNKGLGETDERDLNTHEFIRTRYKGGVRCSKG